MEIQLFDLLLLFILAFCSALLVGFNILNNIEINVPVCPQIQTQKINSKSEEIEKFSPNELPINIIENSDIENSDLSGKPIIIRQGYQSSDQNIGNNITYPAADDIVRYRGPGCYKNIDITDTNDTNDTKPANNRTCRPYAGKIRENAYNIIKTNFLSPSSNDPNNTIQQDIKLYVPRVYMGKDPYISGISYASMNLEIPADIDQMGQIPVNDFNGEPVAINSLMSD
jgi:hypothetical protein